MRTYRVGLVGCGHISMTHLRAWKKIPGFPVHGVFDLNQELARKRAEKFKVNQIYDDLDKIIADCDIIDVCTPPQTHSAIAKQVLAAGKHLVIEKPLVTNLADWDEMKALLSQSQSQIAVIHNLKYGHSIQQAKRWVEAGQIGKIIRVQREFLTSPETDRMLVGNSHWSHQLPGGRWFETLPHELYLNHYFAGNLELADVSVIQTPSAPAGAPADEVLISLKNGECLATIHFSANCQQNRRVFTLHGTTGTITVDILSDFATLTESKDVKGQRAVGRPLIEAKQTLFRAIPDRVSYFQRRVKAETPHFYLIQAFGRYLLGQGPAPTPLDEIDYVVRNCDRIGRAIDRELAEAKVAHASY